jgi:hypothetical protein
MIRIRLPEGISSGHGDPTDYEIALGIVGRLGSGDVDGFESMPGLQKTIDRDDRPNRSHEYGLP